MSTSNNDGHELVALARAEKARGNDHAACNYLCRAAALDEAAMPLLLELGAALRALARADEAITVYERILALEPHHVGAHFALGWIARTRQDDSSARGHFTVALEELRHTLERTPDNVHLRAQLATALRELGDFDESAAIYQRILSTDARHAASHDGLGWIAWKRHDTTGALEHFRAVAALAGPDDGDARLNFARLLVMMRQVAEGKEIYASIDARGLSHARVSAGLGALARSWHDWPAALEHYATALKLDPGNIASCLALGHTLRDLSRWDESENIFREVLASAPRHVEALLGLAETARARGNTATALELFEAVANLSPLDYRPKNALRRLKVAQGVFDWKTEVEEAVTVARAPGATAAAQLEAARTLVQYGLTEVAIPLLERLQAHSSEARQLGMALQQMARLGLAQPILPGTAHPDPADNQLESLEGFLDKPVPGAHTLLLVFAGTNNRTWMTFTLLHRVLRKTGVSIVYVRDLRRDWYATGVVGLGDDFDSTVAGFRKLAESHGAKRILTLGNCIGCLGALRFGLSLGAAGVLGLGPKLRPGDDLEADHKLSLRAFRERRSPVHQSIRERYLTAVARPKVTLFFGEHCGTDAADAQSLAEVPGVTATAIRGSSDPDSLKDLLVLGELDSVLQEFVTQAAIAPAVHERIAAASVRGPGA
jgi:tetratricopeptide (TPR) repeat protein